MIPAGVHGRNPSRPDHKRPTLTTCKPSTSLSGLIASKITDSRTALPFGNGNCTKMPCVSGSALSDAISSSTTASLVSLGSSVNVLSKPIFLARRVFIRV